jgi:hypothetical protein
LKLVLHDWLYASEKFSRSKCDWILLEALQELGAWWLTRNTIYSHVRAYGWAVWSNHDKARTKMLRLYELEFKKRLQLSDSPWKCLI